MFDRTQKAIDQLAGIEWFESVGKACEEDNVNRVYSWEQAIQMSFTDKWINTLTEARNEIFRPIDLKLEAFKPESKRSSRPVLEEIDAQIQPLVDSKIATLVDELHLSARFVRTVSWSIVAVVFAVEYSDVYESVFYGELRAWYLRGHLPCGWKGNYPRGKLVVF